MTRHRLAVALLPPEQLSLQVDGLRRMLGDHRLGELASHVTLVPPVNVRHEALPGIRRHLREIATGTERFELFLGPAATFAPATPTVHLSVGGDLERLFGLRGQLKSGPLQREDEWPFVPHVTLRESVAPELLAASLTTLSGSLGQWPVDRLYLLERVEVPEPVDAMDDTDRGVAASVVARMQWRAVVEEPFGGPDVVGRGGIELVLRTLQSIEPEVGALVGGSPTQLGEALVVVAELPAMAGAPIAAIVGSSRHGVADLTQLHVSEEHQGMGIGRQVAARWCVEAARRGANVAVADAAVGGGALEAWGFSRVGHTLMRQLGTARAE